MSSSPSGVRRDASTSVAFHVHRKETPKAHVFTVSLPGVPKENIKVNVHHGRVLQISVERNYMLEERTDTWHSVERSSGKFLWEYSLSENDKVHQVKAEKDNGVVTVTVPKN